MSGVPLAYRLLSGFFRCRFRQGSSQPRKILLVKTHAIGDVLMVSPAIEGLRRLFPEAHLAFLTGAWSAPVLSMCEGLDDIIVFADADLHEHHTGRLWSLIRQIRSMGFDTALIFHPSPVIQLLVAAMGIPGRIGLDHHGSGFSCNGRVPWVPNGDRYAGDMFFDLVRELGDPGVRPPLRLAVPEAARESIGNRLASIGIDSGPLVVMCPGGGRNPRDMVSAKLWSSAGYGDLAAVLV
ncbi:glycosyltransferase family 9 protein, partial [bacterium]|nr:glycosyltransferase family 9 protein [candidate division CSSED10-310 bacterium]